jgi:signal transduction histidine kinase/CheY-like chemotaxis protein
MDSLPPPQDEQLLSSLRREIAFGCDADGRVSWIDASGEALLGARSGDFFLAHVAPGGQSQATALLDAARRRRVDRFPLELMVGGASLPCLFNAMPASGGAVFVGTPIDREPIADHRASADGDQRQRAEQLAELARRKDEFLGMLAHELRNPLNAIAAANSLMDRVGAQDERCVRLRTTVRRQTRALARLVDDLLEVSRVTRGTMRLQPETADLGTILRSAIENSRTTIEARNQQLDVSVPQTPMPINADALRLEQVFVNLLQNASKYSQPGTRVALECIRSADDGPSRACVKVRDQGVGIPVEKLEPIFELFFQVDQTLARSLGGLGLGLTIARRLVELHGGTIRAASDGLNRGSEFIVELPLLTEVTAPSATADDADASADGGSRIVLLIEDNADAREMLHAWLDQLGHEVHEAADGLAGLELARTVRPDVALIDIGLPGIDGYQVARNLRESPECCHAFLVAITGYGRPEDTARAREAGFDLHLVKPVQPERIARVLRSRPANSASFGG